MRDVANTANNLINMFPEIKAWIEKQGGLTITSTNNKKAIAETSMKRPVIGLNISYYNSMKRLLNTTFRNAKKGGLCLRQIIRAIHLRMNSGIL